MKIISWYSIRVFEYFIINISKSGKFPVFRMELYVDSNLESMFSFLCFLSCMNLHLLKEKDLNAFRFFFTKNMAYNLFLINWILQIEIRLNTALVHSTQLNSTPMETLATPHLIISALLRPASRHSGNAPQENIENGNINF